MALYWPIATPSPYKQGEKMTAAQAAEMSRSHRETIYQKGRAGDKTMCFCLSWQNTFTYKDLSKKKSILDG